MDYYIPPQDFPAPMIRKQKMLNVAYIIDEDGKPTEENLKSYAEELNEIFSDGLQLHDFADIALMSVKHLNYFFTVSIHDKRQAVITILNFIIDITDTPYLPDSIFDPIFKALVPSFVNLIIPESVEEVIPHEKFVGSPTYDNIIDCAKLIIEELSDGLEYKDLATITGIAIRYVNKFMDSSNIQKISQAKIIVNYVLKNSFVGSKYIPDAFLNLTDGFIEHIISDIAIIADYL